MKIQILNNITGEINEVETDIVENTVTIREPEVPIEERLSALEQAMLEMILGCA